MAGEGRLGQGGEVWGGGQTLVAGRLGGVVCPPLHPWTQLQETRLWAGIALALLTVTGRVTTVCHITPLFPRVCCLVLVPADDHHLCSLGQGSKLLSLVFRPLLPPLPCSSCPAAALALCAQCSIRPPDLGTCQTCGIPPPKHPLDLPAPETPIELHLLDKQQ